MRPYHYTIMFGLAVCISAIALPFMRTTGMLAFLEFFCGANVAVNIINLTSGHDH